MPHPAANSDHESINFPYFFSHSFFYRTFFIFRLSLFFSLHAMGNIIPFYRYYRNNINNIFIYTQLFMCSGQVHDPISQFSSRPLYVCKFRRQGGHRSFLRPWPPSLQYRVSLTFADTYSCTLRPIDLYNVKPIPRE
jgi:hypothetical protein